MLNNKWSLINVNCSNWNLIFGFLWSNFNGWCRFSTFNFPDIGLQDIGNLVALSRALRITNEICSSSQNVEFTRKGLYWKKASGHLLSTDVPFFMGLLVSGEYPGKWCNYWESRGSQYFTVKRLILMSGPSGTRRSSFLSRVTLNQAVHHFGKGSDFCM